jgi:hypothetical protein
MVTDSGAFPQRAHPGQSPGSQARADAGRLGGGALDSEHRRAVAPAALVLSDVTVH